MEISLLCIYYLFMLKILFLFLLSLESVKHRILTYVRLLPFCYDFMYLLLALNFLFFSFFSDNANL